MMRSAPDKELRQAQGEKESQRWTTLSKAVLSVF